MQVRELNHVAVHVADVDASCRFYEECLRLTRLPRPAFSFPGAWFRLGSQQELHLIGGRDPKSDSGGHRRGNHYALLVDDLVAWAEHLRACDVPFEGPRDRPDGAQQIFLRDPDGHVIELCTSPP